MTHKDSDKTKEARQARYSEFLGLKSLPYFSDEQMKRLRRLEKLRREDNKIAMKEAA